MKKLFVILLTICIFLLPGCKPELPGVTIYIQNADNLEIQPASYELEILFTDNDRALGARAFHMENIGSDIVTNSRSIVLENMPKALYIAQVKAYDKNGRLVGQGQTDLPFMASTTSSINVIVNEMPYATCSKKFNFPYGSIDSIKLNIKDSKGKLILEENYLDLSDTTFALATTGKIRIDSNASTFEWILKKGNNAVAVYIDTLDSKLISEETRILNEVSFEMGFQEIADWTAKTFNFDKITLKVVPDEKLRDTISGFDFIISNSTGNTGKTFRDLSPENFYQLPFSENETITHNITVIPVLKDRETEIKSLSQTVKAQPNIKLESIEFEGIDTGKVQNLELGFTDLKFDIRKKPAGYTKFGEGELKITSGDSITFNMTKDGHVTITPVKPGATTLTYTEPTYNISKAITVNVELHKPVINIESGMGSYFEIHWDYIHPDSKVLLHFDIQPLKKDEAYPISDQPTSPVDITEYINQGYYSFSQFKNSKGTYKLEVIYPGVKPIESNELEYTTGENHNLIISIPEIKDMNIGFTTDNITITERIPLNEEVHLSAIRNDQVKNISWKIKNRTVSEEDTLIYKTSDPTMGFDWHKKNGRVDIVLVVEAIDSNIYSKNITLYFDMENSK